MSFLYRHRLLLGFICILLAVAVTVGICFFALSRTAAEAQRLTIVIDPGHGGVDGGVVGITTGMKESDINLAVSLYLKEELEETGFRVVMTRMTEAGLYGTATAGYKKRDMKKRAEIIRSSAPALVLSVHQNFFSLRSRRGAQVFYKESSASSKTLACMIQSAFNDMPECARQSAPLAGDYYVLNCSDYPSVIVECGFLSNAEDEALLTTAEYQKRVAETIAAGAMGFLSAVADNTV